MSELIVTENGLTIKRCSKCGQEKSFSEFYKAKHRKYGLRWCCKQCQSFERSNNKEKDSKYFKERYAVKRKEILDRHKKYYNENKERIKQQVKAYRDSNKEKANACHKIWYEKNKDTLKVKAKEWRMKNKATVSARRHKRRARERNAVGSFAQKDIQKLLSAQKERCAYCRKKIAGKYHIDHIYPLARGGSNNPDNLQILCQVCNQQKNAMDPIEFAQKIGLLL